MPDAEFSVRSTLDSARRGCGVAAGDLINLLEGWVITLSAKYGGHNPADRDDLAQVGRDAVLKSIRGWDPGEGVEWKTYAESCVAKNIARAAKKQALHRSRFPLPDSAEVGDRLANPDGSIMEGVPGPAGAFRWLAADLVRDALATLDDSQRLIVSRVYGIERPAEPPRVVAKSMGIDATCLELRLATALLTLSHTPGLEALLDPDYTPEAC